VALILDPGGLHDTAPVASSGRKILQRAAGTALAPELH
jgi:hypothetical protein